MNSWMGANCHHKDFTGRVLIWENFIHPKTTYFTQRKKISGKKQIPKWAPSARVVQPTRSPENRGTTVVSIGHWTLWPENPGHHTQVWDNMSNPSIRYSWMDLSQETTLMMRGICNINIQPDGKYHCGDKKQLPDCLRSTSWFLIE